MESLWLLSRIFRGMGLDIDQVALIHILTIILCKSVF